MFEYGVFQEHSWGSGIIIYLIGLIFLKIRFFLIVIHPFGAVSKIISKIGIELAFEINRAY